MPLPAKDASLDTLRGMRKQADAYSIPSDYTPDYMHDIVVEEYASWRYAMVEWLFEIRETFSFEQDTIEITLSILDRYVAAKPGLMLDSDKYQLAALTSVYIAAKIHEESCLTPHHIEMLSDCLYSTETVEKQEVLILNAIQWRVNPPTVSVVAGEILNVVPTELIQRDQILKIVEEQMVLVLFEEYFVPENTFNLAVAALYNAFSSYATENKEPLPKYVEQKLLSVAGLSKNDMTAITSRRSDILGIISEQDEAIEPINEETDAPVAQQKKNDALSCCPNTPIRSASRRTIAAIAG